MVRSLGRSAGHFDFELPELPPYEPPPSQAPQAKVGRALELARRHESDPREHARFLASVGELNLGSGDVATALLAFSTGERLHLSTIRSERDDPLPLAFYLRRVAASLREHGHTREAAAYEARKDAIFAGQLPIRTR